LSELNGLAIWATNIGNAYLEAITKEKLYIIASILINKYKFKLKGSAGPISFHLGCDFERDEDGNLCMVPQQYIEQIVAQYEGMFSSKPRTHYTSPLEKNDHPEEDAYLQTP
jgi:hypothetical protein